MKGSSPYTVTCLPNSTAPLYAVELERAEVVAGHGVLHDVGGDALGAGEAQLGGVSEASSSWTWAPMSPLASFHPAGYEKEKSSLRAVCAC